MWQNSINSSDWFYRFNCTTLNFRKFKQYIYTAEVKPLKNLTFEVDLSNVNQSWDSSTEFRFVFFSVFSFLETLFFVLCPISTKTSLLTPSIFFSGNGIFVGAKTKSSWKRLDFLTVFHYVYTIEYFVCQKKCLFDECFMSVGFVENKTKFMRKSIIYIKCVVSVSVCECVFEIQSIQTLYFVRKLSLFSTVFFLFFFCCCLRKSWNCIPFGYRLHIY